MSNKEERIVKQHTAVETFMYDLKKWLDKALDNENVSDGLYGFVKDMVSEVKADLRAIELDYYRV